MASREELLSSIRPDMKLDGNFFMKVYGYELTWPGFADQALSKLEAAGCSRARQYYNRYITEYEQQQEQQIKKAAQWYAGQIMDRKVVSAGNGERRKPRHQFAGFPENW